MTKCSVLQNSLFILKREDWQWRKPLRVTCGHPLHRYLPRSSTSTLLCVTVRVQKLSAMTSRPKRSCRLRFSFSLLFSVYISHPVLHRCRVVKSIGSNETAENVHQPLAQLPSLDWMSLMSFCYLSPVGLFHYGFVWSKLMMIETTLREHLAVFLWNDSLKNRRTGRGFTSSPLPNYSLSSFQKWVGTERKLNLMHHWYY